MGAINAMCYEGSGGLGLRRATVGSLFRRVNKACDRRKSCLVPGVALPGRRGRPVNV